MKKSHKKVLVAVSGGVDSSVALWLLKKQGYDPVGVFLHFWKEQGSVGENKCCSLKAANDARDVCRQVGVPFYTLNFAKVFKDTVVDNFLDEYGKGRTPNPCVLCNKKVKIGLLLDYAKKMGFDYLATGHYVRLEKNHLVKAKDKTKDQSYFLYTLINKDLDRLLFPVGKYLKTDIRKMAAKAKLKIASKPDSQEICFIPEKHHEEFLKRYLKFKPGEIRLFDEQIIGQHKGLPLYTIGQRRGIDIGGKGPYYAAKFDFKNNRLYVVAKFDDPKIYANGFKLTKAVFSKEIKLPLKCKVVIRYRHEAQPCTIAKNYQVTFTKPQRAVTSGQSAVFYQGNKVVGGGIIN